MTSEADMLLEVLQKQESLFNDTVSGYQKDRVVRQQEFDLKEKDYSDQIQGLQTRLQERKDLNYKLTSEYFAYKNAATEDKKRLQDAIELAKLERDQLMEAAEKAFTQEEQNCQYNENLYGQKTKQFANRFRKANLKNEEELNIIKTQFTDVQGQYLNELKNLKK